MAVLPDVVNRLADDIQWTTDLGNAFLAQQSDVMDAVQRMRKKAQGTGALASNEQQKVETKVVENKTVIVVEQANPQVVYVPSYNPVVVYGPPVYPYPPIYYPYYAARGRVRREHDRVRRRRRHGRGVGRRLGIRLRLGRQRHRHQRQQQLHPQQQHQPEQHRQPRRQQRSGSTTRSIAAARRMRTGPRPIASAGPREATRSRHGSRGTIAAAARPQSPAATDESIAAEQPQSRRERGQPQRPVGAGGADRVGNQPVPRTCQPEAARSAAAAGGVSAARHRSRGASSPGAVSVAVAAADGGRAMKIMARLCMSSPAAGLGVHRWRRSPPHRRRRPRSRSPKQAAPKAFETPQQEPMRSSRRPVLRHRCACEHLRRRRPGPGRHRRPVQDKNRLEEFAARARERKTYLDPTTANRAILSVGDDDLAPADSDRPTQARRGHLTPASGREEILYRRIGGNELDAIQICRGYRRGAARVRAHEARRPGVNSTPSASSARQASRTAWPGRTADGSWDGPVGEAVARAIRAGIFSQPEPYNGYYFKVLTGQGPAAPLGEPWTSSSRAR